MSRINKALTIEKGLIVNSNQSKYDLVVNIYKYILEYYINSKINLSKYDNLIKNSDLFIGVNTKYKSLNYYLNLEYIFLINNLFIEKLSIEDINLLIDKFDKNNISNELINIVERTYKDVIYDNYIKGQYQNIICNVCYGPPAPFNLVNNNVLVFKIYYGKNLITLDGDEFVELHKKQLAFFDDLINKLKTEVKETLNINCEVLLEKDIY